MQMRFRRFQEGGPMPAGPEAGGAPMGPEQGGGEDPVMELAQMAQQALEGQVVKQLCKFVMDYFKCFKVEVKKVAQKVVLPHLKRLLQRNPYTEWAEDLQVDFVIN